MGGIGINSGTLELGTAGAAGAGAIRFDSGNADPTLEFSLTSAPSNPIDNFGPNDDIIITGFAATAESYQSGVLKLAGTGGPVDLTISGPGLATTSDFVFAVDSTADTTTIETAPCYCRGTLIRTNRGHKRVENLKIGDMVKTAAGAARPVKWIGRRSYGGRFILGRKDVLPICIKAGALADNVPRRDLWISPHHAMYLDGVLIEVKDLVNGVSILQAERVKKVEYFHVELDTHDIIIAEGAPSESFLDDDSRGMFHNAHEYHALYPDAARAPARYCAPRLEDGYAVEVVRRRIAVRAGLRKRDGEPRIGKLRGYIDLVSPRHIAGWAQNVDHPEAPVCLDVYAGGRLIGRTLANRYRDDLARAGLGSGRHAFEFVPPPGLTVAPGVIEVRRSLDGARLTSSKSRHMIAIRASR